jgi:hypothetical protein
VRFQQVIAQPSGSQIRLLTWPMNSTASSSFVVSKDCCKSSNLPRLTFYSIRKSCGWQPCHADLNIKYFPPRQPAQALPDMRKA